MKKLLLILSFLLLWSCSSSSPKGDFDGDHLNDVLISFTYNSQANRWDDVLALVTYEEQLQLLDENGSLKTEYQTAMKRLQISILQKENLTLDYKGRLVGIVRVLEESNRRFLISDEQRAINLSTVEKSRPKKEEDKKDEKDSSDDVKGEDQAEETESSEEVAAEAESEDDVDDSDEADYSDDSDDFEDFSSDDEDVDLEEDDEDEIDYDYDDF